MVEAKQDSAKMPEGISQGQVTQPGRDTIFGEIIYKKILTKIILEGKMAGCIKLMPLICLRHPSENVSLW